MYRHRQVGYVPMVIGVILSLTLGGIAWQRAPILGAVVLVIIALGPLLFSYLTITIGDGALACHFGFGFWPKRFPLADIVDATLSPSSWIDGWGIRVTPSGMLYNVSGTGAVEVRLRSGTRFRLGSDEPDVLLHALKAAIASSHDVAAQLPR
jgi:hypothetical protein